jgi:uncharacterized protein YehS (DUF1456 family)
VELVALGGETISIETAAGLHAKRESMAECSAELLSAFLEGLIIDRRGPRDPSLPAVSPEAMSHNLVLKKTRIAMSLDESEVLAVFRAGGVPFTKQELRTLYRKRGNKHYRECSDDVLTGFLVGLTLRLRPDSA